MESKRIEKIVEQISKLEEEISNLKNSIGEREKEAKEVEEWPQVGDEYYAINDFGSVIRWTYKGDWADIGAFEIGNAFKTKEEAEFEVEKKKVIAELSRFCEPYSSNTHCVYLYYLRDTDEFVAYTDPAMEPDMGAYCFEDEDVALKAVKEIGGDRIAKYLFGVED